MAADAAIPQMPKLRFGCSVFDIPEGIVIRSVARAFLIDLKYSTVARPLITCLDGKHTIEQLLGDATAEFGFYALRLFAALAENGLISESTDECDAQAVRCTTNPGRLDGVRLVSVAPGLLSDAVSEFLLEAGAEVSPGELNDAFDRDAVALVCLDCANISTLESINSAALNARVPWLTIFPFGDGAIVSPVFRPPSSPCFGCFELRWIGISPSIALELAYFTQLRLGNCQDGEILDRDRANVVASIAIKVAKKYLMENSQRSFVGLVMPNGSSTEGVLEPHPHCEYCSTRSKAPDTARQNSDRQYWDDSSVPLTQLAEIISPLADSPFGIARIVPSNIQECHSDNSTLLEIIVARFAHPNPQDVGSDQDNWCHGAAANKEAARALAIIEAAERYNGLSRPPIGVFASYNSVAAEAILPTTLPLFAPGQYQQPGFPFEPFDPALPLHWCWGFDLTDNRSVLVPTSAVWYAYHDKLLRESSNGVAAHSSRGHALVNGVLELVERDAFMIHWLHRLAPPYIDASDISDEDCKLMMIAVEEQGYTVKLLNITTDLKIPVVLAIGIHANHSKPALIVGAGAAIDSQTALRRALNELYSSTFGPTKLWFPRPAMELNQVRCLNDHSRAYEHPDWIRHASFLWSSQHRSVSCAEHFAPTCPLDYLTNHLAAHGHHLIGVDMTLPDIAQYGLRVVRAIVPGLQPLGLAPEARLGGRRLQDAPIRMGYKNVGEHPELNPIPHCFP